MPHNLESEDQGQQIVDLYDKLTSMPEYKVLEKIKTLDMFKYVVQGNYTDLKNCLSSRIDINEFRGLRKADKRLKKTATLFETTRLLHNFVMSVRTCIGHTRLLYWELYQKTGEIPEYGSEIEKRFKKDRVVRFIEDLNEYSLHFQALPVSSSLYWSQMHSVDNTGIRLEKNELSKYPKWSRDGKKYLADQGDHIDLLGVVSEYYAVVMGFCEWFQSKQKEIHSAAIKQVNTMQKKIESLLKKEYSRY